MSDITEFPESLRESIEKVCGLDGSQPLRPLSEEDQERFYRFLTDLRRDEKYRQDLSFASCELLFSTDPCPSDTAILEALGLLPGDEHDREDKASAEGS